LKKSIGCEAYIDMQRKFNGGFPEKLNDQQDDIPYQHRLSSAVIDSGL
jgi:hypothetical protein